MKKNYFQYLTTLLLLALMLTASGQTIPVTPFSFDQDLRVLQLQGKIPVDYSMNVRPFSFTKRFKADSLYQLIGAGDERSFKEAKVEFFKGHGKLALLPVSSITKFTSHHPYGGSDGAFMPVNGFQQLITTGFYGEIGPLSLQIKPEIFFAENKPYETTSQFGQVTTNGRVKKILPGQSRAALNLGPLSFALSTENLWWGPGQYSSLMMSNNAPGFSHVSFSTNKPVKSIFGSFEWQIIGGFALSDDKIPEQVYSLKSFEEFAIPLGWPRDKILSNYNKYFNGVTFSFSPKFLKTLKLGFSRAYIASFADIQSNIVERVGFVKAYIPLFASVFKESRIGFEDSLEWNQLASISARLLLPKANAEIYVEYGWNDYKYNLRDFIISPTHSAAYIVGAKKVLQVSKYKAIDFSVEVSNLGQSPDFLVRDAGNWYIHTARSNYTNWGQSLGSGFGLGSNTFHFSAVMRNRFDQFGFVYSNSKKDPLRFATQWHEHLFSFNFRKKIHHFLINSDLGFLYSRNYGWDAGKNRFNFMGMMGLSYFF